MFEMFLELARNVNFSHARLEKIGRLIRHPAHQIEVLDRVPKLSTMSAYGVRSSRSPPQSLKGEKASVGKTETCKRDSP
jgi:hypothetical protein